MTDLRTRLHGLGSRALPGAALLLLVLALPSCARLKRNETLTGVGGEGGDTGSGGSTGVDTGGSGGSRAGSATGGASPSGGRGGSSTGGASSSGAGNGAAAGDAGESGAGRAGTGGESGAGCADACSEPGSFECSDARHVRACVDEGDCAAWHDVTTCPGGFACCGGLCIRDDSSITECSAGGFENPELPVPPGLGLWCSVTLSDGSSDLLWGSEDPCAELLALHQGAVVDRAGLYPARGTTAVLVHCTDYTFVTYGAADVLFGKAYVDTLGDPYECHYRFSPTTLPIFEAPFPASEDDLVRYHVEARGGFDFALDPTELDLARFGVPDSSTLASNVDHYGQDRSSETWANDDDGRDWAMDPGTPIYAVASGRVLASRERGVTRGPGCGASDVRIESEVYVQHDVGHGAYRESFVSYYGHLGDRLVATGSIVTGGALIGHAGRAGCAAEDGLHFAVTRITNTVAWYHQSFEVDTTEVGDNARNSRVEPFGWAGRDVDPWGWVYSSMNVGAFSPRLWKVGQTPPDGHW